MGSTCTDIARARPEEWSAGFQLALQHVPEKERPTRVLNALTLLGAGEIDPQGIFVARSPSGLVGVQVCIPLRGGSALFWLPEISADCNDPHLADRLVRTALDWAMPRGAKIAQTLVHPSALAHADPLVRCGFRHITQLRYYTHNLVRLPAANAVGGLRFESFAEDIEEIFQQTLLRTYEGTQDCPELNGVRSIGEILEGHRAQGVWRPETWWLARWEGKPAGVVLLTELFDGDGWDLSYMGVVPEVRGRGLGKALTVKALEAARKRGAEGVTVAVDVRNGPAIKIYSSLGFVASEQREVLLYLPSG